MLLLALCWGIACMVQAQVPTLAVTTGKTTSLVFPYAVRHVDRGSADVLVQPIRGAGRILLLKAACPHFAETNLSVVTEDGSLYTFRVQYEPEPTRWTYELPARAARPPHEVARSLRDNPPTLWGVRDKAWGVSLTLDGLYLQGDTMYYQLRLENRSPLDYTLDYLRFAVRDRKKARRTGVQEVELQPLHRSGAASGVKANSSEVLVLALPALTLPERKYLAIELGEQSGSRHLALKVGNRRLLRAVPLPDPR